MPDFHVQRAPLDQRHGTCRRNVAVDVLHFFRHYRPARLNYAFDRTTNCFSFKSMTEPLSPAALAQPEPQVLGPTDKELDAVWFAARWGRPAQSKPQGPTDEELDAIWFASGSGVDGREWRTFARAVLARWGRPAVEPTDDDLSPAARAIVAAFNARHELCGPFDGNWPELCQAAALRAAADQSENLYDPHEGKVCVVRVEHLITIADELETQ